MVGIHVTRTARIQINALDDAAAQSVDSAIQTLDKRTGEPIDLPSAPAGTSYLALPTRRSQNDEPGPVIIYRPRLPREGGGWLVVSLLSPDEYRDVLRAEELVATSPAAREIVGAIVAGTAVTVANAGLATARGTAPQPHAAPTSTTDQPT
jgi:hypothetical protein